MLNLKNFEQSKKILIQEINQNDADALIINSFQNRFWLMNFESSDGFVIIQKNNLITFLIDGRYYQKAVEQLGEIINVVLWKSFDDLASFIKDQELNTILIEDSYTNVLLFQKLENCVQEIKLFSAQGIRSNKYESEICNLINAADIAVETTQFIQKYAKPGMSEKEIALAATIKMLKLGASKNAFEPIVASGINGANPHHHPTDKILEENEMISLDLGCILNNYCSDMTRTWAVANTKLPETLEKMHQIVLQAQALGLQTCLVDQTTYNVDMACRKYIKHQGYGEYFVHSTGHGVGIDIHELPAINANPIFKKTLTNGMVITVEPGIYVPGIGGVRIEDTVVINNQKPIILNQKASRKVYFE
ncbi:Aminopeptidase YpdF (MP-, MA-, MS-, AP-, NP- specific) [[Mycoplasma] cavipharyngis]|uniref:aminopeptidase P family protein n=1 Tax=[Mycoplasma] cavipharyngis TaxID=92757 RepID=UPI0037041230